MSGPGNEDNISEMVTPIIEWLDGIIWVLHDTSQDEPGAQFLSKRVGNGKVIHRQFCQRHQVSMNETLFCGLIQEGDLVIWSDCLERPMPQFVSRVKGDISAFMSSHGVDCIFYYGKPFLFRYNETMVYNGSPHWWLTGFSTPMEWSTIYPDETQVRWNARPSKRPDKFGFVSHYLKYYLYPPGSNHCLLGLEKNGNPNELFPPREARRLEFRRLLRRRGVPLTVAGVCTMMENGLDSTCQQYFNTEKILNDAYRHLYLRRTDFMDNHDWSDMIVIE